MFFFLGCNQTVLGSSFESSDLCDGGGVPDTCNCYTVAGKLCSHRLQQKHLRNRDYHLIFKSKEANLSTILTWKRQKEGLDSHNVWFRLFCQPFLFKHIFLNLQGMPSLAMMAVFLFLLMTVGKTISINLSILLALLSALLTLWGT